LLDFTSDLGNISEACKLVGFRESSRESAPSAKDQEAKGALRLAAIKGAAPEKTIGSKALDLTPEAAAASRSSAPYSNSKPDCLKFAFQASKHMRSIRFVCVPMIGRVALVLGFCKKTGHRGRRLGDGNKICVIGRFCKSSLVDRTEGVASGHIKQRLPELLALSLERILKFDGLNSFQECGLWNHDYGLV
jgi:hypothetical protein